MSLRHMEEIPLTTPRLVEEAFSQFPSTLVVLAASVDGISVGMVASTFTPGVSFDPALAVVTIRSESASWVALRRATRLGVSTLGQGQEHLVQQMASRKKDRFAGVEVLHTSDGSIYLPGASLWLGARIASEIPAGDHILVLLHVEAVSIDSVVEPLIYRNRTIRNELTHQMQRGESQPANPRITSDSTKVRT